MENLLRNVSNGLGSFCNHLQSSCDALTQSMNRRPIPLDSASSTFIECLNRRVTSASNDLNLLENMSFGTVSFEELLGHCNEIYKQNETYLLELQDHLVDKHGYVPEIENDGEEDDDQGFNSEARNSNDGLDTNLPSSYNVSQSAASSVMKYLEEDPLLEDESLSLKNLGISEYSLATLASDAKGKIDYANISLQEPTGDKVYDVKGSYQTVAQSLEVTKGKSTGVEKHVEAHGPAITVSKDDYENVPSYMKSLSSWEDVLVAVEKINSYLSKKEVTTEFKYFKQDEIASLGLGPKGKAYLLMLVRMNRLVVETLDGSISYRVL
ncbi:hypothetical protein ACFE04_020702 [Oxalis oulophora]